MLTADHAHGRGYSIIWGENDAGARPEDVLRAVLLRVKHLQNGDLKCAENSEIIDALEHALDYEELRTKRRVEQGVKGTAVNHRSDDYTLSMQGTTLKARLAVDDTPAVGSFVQLAEDDSEPPLPPANPEPTPPPIHHEPPVHQEPPDELSVDEHPHPLDIAFPLQEKRFIPQAVVASIDRQGIPYRLWTSTTYSNGEFALARNNVKDMALKGTSPYILMTDNDLVFGDGDFEAMISFLEAHQDFGAIAISKHGDPDPSQAQEVVEPGHVDAGPVMFRRTTLTEPYLYQDPEHPDAEPTEERFTYDNKHGLCECGAMTKRITEEMGLRIGFLTGRAVKHIGNTMLS